MAITSETSRNDYVGTGLVTTYSYSFRIFSSTHLLVTKRVGTTETTLVLNTDYTVTGVGDAPGGTIVLATALASGAALTIRRVLPLTQPTDISNQGSFFQKTHEDTFDRGVMMLQQQQDEIDRCLKAAETDVALNNLPVASDRANKFLAFNASGQPIASSGGISSSLPVSSFIETLLDDVSAAAARATLGVSVADGVTLQDSGGIISIKDSGVSTAKIADLNVTTGKINDLAVTNGKLAADSVSTVKIVDTSVTTPKIENLAVTTGKIANSAVDENKIAASVAGNGLSGGAGSPLSVNTDDTTIEKSSDALRVKDAGISEAKLASAVVNKLGQNIGLTTIIDSNSNGTKVNYSGQGELIMIGCSGGGIVNGTLTIDGGTAINFSLSAAGRYLVWSPTSPYLVESNGGGAVSPDRAQIQFRSSLLITKDSGAGNIVIIYARAA